MGLLIGPLSGCASLTVNNYCDIASPHYFKSSDTVDLLLKYDRDLLTKTVAHNETYERICS